MSCPDPTILHTLTVQNNYEIRANVARSTMLCTTALSRLVPNLQVLFSFSSPSPSEARDVQQGSGGSEFPFCLCACTRRGGRSWKTPFG